MSTPADSEIKWPRVQEMDDPRRCQAVIHGGTKAGQCTNLSVENSEYCPAHGGNKALESARKEQNRVYRLTRYKARLDEVTDHDKIKSLREEIGVLRIMLEERWNACSDGNELMLASGPISDLVMKIEKLVSSCNRIEGQLGELLDKQKAIQLGQEIVEVIAGVIEDEESLSRIAQGVADAISRATVR